MTCLDQVLRSVADEIRDYCAATLAARLEKALRAMDAGDLDCARALVRSTIRDLGGEQHV